MHSAFNLFVFPNYMFTSLLLFCFFVIFFMKGEIALKNNHYYYYYYLIIFLFNSQIDYWSVYLCVLTPLQQWLKCSLNLSSCFVCSLY